MMRFELGVRTSNVTSGQAVLEIIAGTKGCRILNFDITVASAVAGVFGTGRPAVAGITPTTPVAFLSCENGEPSLAKVALAWATSPTSPAAFFNRASLGNTIGSSKGFVPVSVTSPYGGVWIPPLGTFVLFNITGGPTLDVSMDLVE